MTVNLLACVICAVGGSIGGYLLRAQIGKVEAKVIADIKAEIVAIEHSIYVTDVKAVIARIKALL